MSKRSGRNQNPEKKTISAKRHYATTSALVKMMGAMQAIGTAPIAKKEAMKLFVGVLKASGISLVKKVMVFIHEDGKLVLSARSDGETSSHKCQEIEIGFCTCGESAKKKRMIFCSSCKKDGKHGHYATPLISGNNKLLGVMNVTLRGGTAKNARKSDFLKGLAISATNILERVIAGIKLEQAARYDSLTGLPNRALLFERLNRVIIDVTRYNKVYVLLLIDLDHFKLANDTHGHDAGDHILVVTGKRLLLCVRGSDTVARLGGDEYVIILQEIDDNIQEFTEKKGIEIIEKLGLPFNLPNGKETKIGASIGATPILKNDKPSATLKRADVCLYEAKKNGKNCLAYDSRTGK